VALGALFVFGDGIAGFAAEKNLPIEAIARMPFGMWKPAECPLCAAGVPVEKVSDTV
jgi:orotate phosphoribosyltransferase